MFERVTITVPRDLRPRMKAAKEPVNGSAVATSAFEAHLAEIASRKTTQSMEDAVQRMRASRLAAGNKDYTDGFRRGQDFGVPDADWKFCEGLRLAIEDWDDARWEKAQRDASATPQSVFAWLLKRADPKR